MAVGGLLSFIAGMGTGYMNQEDKRAQRERQDKLDQILLDRADRETADYNKKRADEAAIKAAVSPVAVTAGAGGAVRPDTMDDRDVGLQENLAQPNAGLMPGGYRVGQQTFQDQAAADQAAAAQNAPDARNARLMSVMQGIDPMRAAELDSRIKQNKLADTQVAEAEKKRVVSDMIGKLSVGGWAAVPEIYKGYGDKLTATVKEDGKGGATVYRFDKDGNAVDEHFFPNKMALAGAIVSHADPKLWMEQETRTQERAQDQGNKDRDFGLRQDELKQRSQQSAAQIGIAQAQLGIAQQAAARAAAQDSSEAPLRQLKSTVATLQLALANTDDPAQRQAIQAKLTAIQSGMGADKDAPAEVKLANAYMKAGLAGNMADALRMATTTKDASPEKIRADIFGKALTASMGDVASAKAATEEAMKYFYPAGIGQRAAAQGIKPKTQAEAHAQAKAAVAAGASLESVNKRLKDDMGFEPLK